MVSVSTMDLVLLATLNEVCIKANNLASFVILRVTINNDISRVISSTSAIII